MASRKAGLLREIHREWHDAISDLGNVEERSERIVCATVASILERRLPLPIGPLGFSKGCNPRCGGHHGLARAGSLDDGLPPKDRWSTEDG